LVFRPFECRISGLFTTNEPKPVVKIGKGGSTCSGFGPDPRIKGGQDAPDLATHFATSKGVSICRTVTQNTRENPEKY